MKRRDFLKTVSAGAIGAALGTTLLPAVGKAVEEKAKGDAAEKFHTVDAFAHFSSLEYIKLLEDLSGVSPNPFRPILAHNVPLIDPVSRVQAMDKVGADMQIIIPLPYLESVPAVYTKPAKALRAAQFINGHLASVVEHYPARFRAVALLPTFDAGDMVAELERCVKELHMVGGCFFVSPETKPADHPDYFKLYAKACELDVPIWIHPARSASPGDYAGEEVSRYMLWMSIGWPMDTSIAMNRIVFSGVFDSYPKLKLIVHHRGGLIPFWFNRINGIMLQQGKTKISQPYINHFRKFYIDTACSGVEPEQMSMACKFFGTDHTLFGTDTPLDNAGGSLFYRDARASLNSIGLSSGDLQKIYSKNILNIIP